MNACPIPGCALNARPGELLCAPHWRAVPQTLKSEVWRTWRAFAYGRTAADKLAARRPYLDARQAEIDAVTQSESPLLPEAGPC